MTEAKTDEQRCGFVALIGAPNSGKSTLTNALVGAKVSIVTHKAQTTRGPVRGIALIGSSQVILVDTPGIFQPNRRLDRAMFTSAWDRAGDADIVVELIGGYGIAHGEPGAKKALAGVAAGTGIAVLAVNVLSWLWGV